MRRPILLVAGVVMAAIAALLIAAWLAASAPVDLGARLAVREHATGGERAVPLQVGERHGAQGDLVASVCGGGCQQIAGSVVSVTVASLDSAWYRSVNEFARDTAWAHGVVANYANWAGLVLLALLLVAAWLRGRRRPDAPRLTAAAFLVGAGAVLALLANQAIGAAVSRTRPCHALAHVEVLLPCASDSSFPSDHAMIAGAFAAGLLLLDRRIGLAAVLLALLLAFARVYVGVHYPSDVAGGLAIGAAIGALIVILLRPAATAAAVRLTRTLFRPLIARSSAR